MSEAQIVDGHVVDYHTLAHVGSLLAEAKRLRLVFEAEEPRAKALLFERCGIRARTLITEHAAWLRRECHRLETLADAMIESCPMQVQTDETWSG